MSSYAEFDNKLYETFGLHINHLMFEFSYEFVYYHELAHLFQFKKKEDLKWNVYVIEESTKNKSSSFILYRHLEELDADILGGFSVCRDLLNVFNLMDTELRTEENLKILLSLLISSIFTIARILSDSDGTDFYTFESDYPHPYMRAFYISAHIITDLESKTNIKLTDENAIGVIVENAIQISNCFFEDKYDFQVTNANLEKINEYLANMRESFKIFDYLTINNASEFEI